MNPLIFKSRSAEFIDQVLIWENQVPLVLNTTHPIFFHQVQDGPMIAYTVQSLVQAFCKSQYSTARRKSDSKQFRIVNISNLVKT